MGMFTLIMALTGGKDWGDVAGSASLMGSGYVMLVAFFVIISNLSLVNIVAGMFVDSAIEIGKEDRSKAVDAAARRREKKAEHLAALLSTMDKGHSGNVTREEFMEALEQEEIRRTFAAL